MKYEIEQFKDVKEEELIKIRLEPSSDGVGVVIIHDGYERTVLTFLNTGPVALYPINPVWAEKIGLPLTEGNFLLPLPFLKTNRVRYEAEEKIRNKGKQTRDKQKSKGEQSE